VCCRCPKSKGKCKRCSCVKQGKLCVNCYPGRNDSCANRSS
jgi:hypothetical protein